MSSSSTYPNEGHDGGPTTNEEDQRKAAALQERLKDASAKSAAGGSEPSSTSTTVATPMSSSVFIDPGRHKYVLISAKYQSRPDLPSTDVDAWQRQYFVVSQKGASYHRDVAEPFVYKLEDHGYTSIDITGGGRINLDPSAKRIDVYGHSYGFGLADHALSKAVIEKDPRYHDYEVTWSNDGY